MREDRNRAESPRRLAESSFYEPDLEERVSAERRYRRGSAPEEEENRRATDEDASDVSYRQARVEDSELSQESELGELLAALQEIAQRRGHPSSAIDRWLRTEVSPDITLSVRGATDEAAPLLERAVHLLRRLMRSRAELAVDEEEGES